MARDGGSAAQPGSGMVILSADDQGATQLHRRESGFKSAACKGVHATGANTRTVWIDFHSDLWRRWSTPPSHDR